MMVVEIDDEHPRGRTAARCLIRARGDRNVVENAEAHTARGFGVMTGRPKQREHGIASASTRFCRLDGAPGRAARDGVRPRIDDHVPGGKIARNGCAGAFAFRQLDVCSRVDAFDLFVACVACRDRPLENVGGTQTSRDRLNAIGPFRVLDAAQVLCVERVADEPQPECFPAG
jgi:hypothetical protein